MSTLNKKELIERVENNCGYSKEEIEEVLSLLMNEIGAGLGRGESVSLSGYGIFIPRIQKLQREGQNGSTAWWREGGGRTTAIFKPGKDMLSLINRKSANGN